MKIRKIFLMAFLLIFTACSYAQVAVIANKSVSDNSINSAKLTDIYFLRAKTWSNGQGIVAFTIKSDNSASEKFYSAIGKADTEMKKMWMKLQLTGEGMAPDALGSDDEMINKIASTSGAIGYIDASKVNDKVKVLLTIK